MQASRIFAFATLALVACQPIDEPTYGNPKVDGGTHEDADPADGAEPDACEPTTYYADCDGDGIASIGAETKSACTEPAPSACGGGWVTTQAVAGTADCNDTRADVHPGAAEPCDGVDNDCDGSADEDGASTFFLDSDGDTHGNPASSMVTCMPPANYVPVGDDCNDSANNVYPGHAEPCDTVDNNCNGQIDEGVLATFYRDLDNDGHGNPTVTTTACSAPAGWVASTDDCNDNSNLMYPGRTETCDGLDNNCNAVTDEGVTTTYYQDADGDGFGNVNASMQACSAPAGYTLNTMDCNDNTSAVNPNAVERCFNNTDDNCNNQQDEVAACFVDCNWSGAKWLSAGYDGNGADDVGAWATCQNGKLSYMQAVGPQITRPATGTSTDYLDCDWGATAKWISQGWDQGAAFSYGANVVCNGSRVTSLLWGSDQLMPGQIPTATNGQQLGCNWSGAIYLAKGIDGNCAPYNGVDVTCSGGHITGMHWWYGGTCGP